MDTLVRRYPRLELQTERPERREDLITFRRLARLPVAVA